MTQPPSSIRINEQRFKTNFEALGRIGAADAGGVQRPALSAADLETRAWLRERIEAAGVITQAELQRWRASLERAAAEGVFFASGTGAILAGRKPG